MSAAAFFDAFRAWKREVTGDPSAVLLQSEVDAINVLRATWRSPAEANPTALSDGGAFFASLRAAFGPLTQSQVDGIQVLLQAFGVARWPIAWAAYGLATAWHETAARMEPVKEAFWLGEDWRRTNLRYFPWYGRGFVQLTWQKNYELADHELGLAGALLADPDSALEPKVAADVMVKGMEQGWFCNRSLKDCLPLSGEGGFDAFKAARAIINGTDKADVIAKEAQQFQAALIAGGWR